MLNSSKTNLKATLKSGFFLYIAANLFYNEKIAMVRDFGCMHFSDGLQPKQTKKPFKN
jgi:hypothetical protein